MYLSFDRLQDGHGVDIVDNIEGRKCTLQTSEPITPVKTSVEDFQFPVDQGISFEAKSIQLPHRVAVFLWNSAGFQFDELTKGESGEYPEDEYIIEMTAPVKLYLVASSELNVEITEKEVHIEFGETAEVKACARSFHKLPADTITTTEEPEDMMAAVSALSSSLKAISPERSYPTLRGHPPAIELGDELDIPEAVESAETDVTIEVPPTISHVFVVAPLAFYLGARVVSGPVPKLVTETGFEHELDDRARGFEGEVERVLKQTFFLDCLTRTEGFYPVSLHERNVLEASLDLDFDLLYDATISKQLEQYLKVPYEMVKSEIPEWRITAHLNMSPKNIEALPFIINDLGVIRSARSQSSKNSATVTEDVTEPVRAGGSAMDGDFLRGTAAGEIKSATVPSLVQPEETDSLEQAWLAEGAPVSASKAIIEAYRNRLEREPSDGDIDITVICNDAAMNDERDIVDDIYGSREEIPFDIEDYHELSTHELRSVLEDDHDFLHYIGHIDERGFECSDGYLDAKNLEQTGIDSFLLNACTSYQQGMELIRAGSIAGVVTVEDVINSGAETIGKTLAKLLNYGFPFSAALSLAKNQSIVGGLYLVLGDGGTDIAQTQSAFPGLCVLSDGEGPRLKYRTFTTIDKGLGSITIPYVGNNDEYYLAGGKTGEFDLSQEELEEFFSLETMPILFNDKLHWTDETSVSEL